jgi:glycosyltransferase involved in cell wall biosynthesis
VDDGSPDGEELSAALLPYGAKVTLLRKPNGGASSARNHGVARASGEWVAFLDADDYWESQKLERQLAVAAAHPEVAVVGCRWYEEYPGSPREPAAAETGRFCERLLRLHGREAFDAAMTVWTGSLLVRREALGAEPFVSGLEPAEDRDLWVRLIAARPAYILPDFLATYVQEPGGISRLNPDKDCGNMLRVVQRYTDLLGPSGLRAEEATVFRRWAALHLAQGRPREALPRALRRLRLQPLSAQAWWIVLKSGFRCILPGAER